MPGELAEHAFETGGGTGRVLVPLPALSAGNAHCRDRVPVLVSAGCARCMYIVQPCSSQPHVMRFCLAIWVYAGVICCRGGI